MGRRTKRIISGLGFITATLVVLLKALSVAGQPPERPESPTSLPACPDSPNCVASRPGEDAVHSIAPFLFSGDPAAALKRLEAVAVADGGKVVRAGGRYLHLEYRSRVFRFVDDVEFLLSPEPGRIEVRSASRSGHSDMGVNRRRVERLRRAFQSGMAG